MPVAKLLVNEKSVNLGSKNIYVLAFDDPKFSVNKIEFGKLLKKQGLTPEEIKIVNLPAKVKMKMSTRRKTAKNRPKKYYVKLKQGEKIDENFELKVENN